MLFQGSGVAIVTPFYEDGSIDYPSLKNLIEFQIENNTDAIIIAGTTGETATLSNQEQIEIIEFAVKEVDSRVPVIAGTGTNNTLETVYLSQEAQKLGVDGLLIVTPYYNKSTQEGLYEHYEYIHEQTSLPILLYNVPSRTNVHLDANTVYELSKLERIVGIKDASGDFSHLLEIKSLCDEDFVLYSGNDDQIVPMLALGAQGVISVLANIAPLDTHDMVMEYLKGNHEKALKLQVDYQKLISLLFVEPSPIAVKYALHKMSFIDNVLRRPLSPLSDSYTDEILMLMKERGLLWKYY